jgi:peptidoglycan hydrolase-like protein with peptidoglycan-binding domain
VRKAARAEEDAVDERPRWFVLAALGWNHKDAIAFGVASVAVIAIVVNGLMFQRGPHPAPMFKNATAVVRDVPASPLPGEPAAVKGNLLTRPTPEIVADIQRELVRRGFFDGVVDGRYGPRTEAAVREFEQAAGLKPSTAPNEALLTTIRRSSVKSTKAASTTSGIRPPTSSIRATPRRSRSAAASRRVLSVQRALAEYGYGQIKPSGVVDAETKAAIERFERERRLPITGQASDRVARELAAVTGRVLE